MLKKWDRILLIEDMLNEYINNDSIRLSWDERRSLSVEDYSLYYFVCEFDDWTSLIHETIDINKIDLDDDEKENPYHSALIVPTNIFYKADIQIDPIYEINIPVEWISPNINWIYSKDEYIIISKNNTQALINEIDSINKYTTNVWKFLRNIIISYTVDMDTPLNKEVRLEYDINNELRYLLPDFIGLLSYSLVDNYETRIKKDDSLFNYLFNLRLLFNKLINSAHFTKKDKETHWELKNEDWSPATICDLKIWFSKNDNNKIAITFKKTQELIDYVNS